MLPVLIALAVILLVFVAYVASRPNEFVVRRTAVMPVSPDRVFPWVNNLKSFNQWSPWSKLDPNCRYTFTGPDSGVGAKLHWSGNKKVGEGLMHIQESQLNRLIKMDLEFIRPFPSQSQVEFQFEPQNNQTQVSWTMVGKNTFMSKMFCLIMNMDKMVGGDFQRGLENLRACVV